MAARAARPASRTARSHRTEPNGGLGSARPNRLGEWIRATRSGQGVSQRALADRSGVSRSYLCDIERGRGAQPSFATLDKLAAALGASRADLLRVAGVLEPSSGIRSDAAELRVVALYRDLSGDNRALVERFARFLHHEEHHLVQVSLPDGLATEEDGRGGSPAASRQTGPTLFDVLLGQRQAGD